jgi:hypothetical protein
MLLSEENVMDVVGALEYDPELAVRQNHRAFLREHVIFKEACHSLQLAFTAYHHMQRLLINICKRDVHCSSLSMCQRGTRLV